MATGNPDPVEVWAPMFLTFAGSGAPKFTEEQILDEAFAISFGHCKLCDDTVVGPVKLHMRKHKQELRGFTDKRRKENAKKSAAGLAAARKEKAMLRAQEEASEVIANLSDYPGGDDDE